MDLRPTAAEEAFREEVRDFVEAQLPADIRDKVLGHQRMEKDDYVRWHRILHAHGWGAPGWPKEFGGTGWNTLQRLIFDIETGRAGAPQLLPFGISMIGPVLIKYASPELQARFLPRIPGSTTSGARATRSPAPAPIWLRSGRARSGKATAIS